MMWKHSIVIYYYERETTRAAASLLRRLPEIAADVVTSKEQDFSRASAGAF